MPEISVQGKWAFIAREDRTFAFALMGTLEDLKGFTKQGSFRFRPTPYNLRLIEESGGTVLKPKENPWEDVASDTRPHYAPPKTYHNPKTKSSVEIIEYDHQKSFFEKFKDLRIDGAFVAALFAEMGTGKTKMAIDMMNYHFCMNRIDAVIVLAKKGVHAQWASAKFDDEDNLEELSPIAKFTQDDIGYDTFIWGKNRTHQGDMPEAMYAKDNRLKWAFFNFEAHTSKKAAATLRGFVHAHKGRVAFIADESHKLKTVDAKRTKYATAISHFCNVRCILTGTPIAKNLEDEYSQLRIIGPSILGHKFVTAFRNEFCLLGGFTGRQVVGAKNIEKFKEITGPYVFRITKKECIDLPEKQYVIEDFPMTAEQHKLINELKQNTRVELPNGAVVEYETPMGVLGGIQQISNGFLMQSDGGIYILNQNPRVDKLLELTEDSEEKFVIWAKYHQDMEVLKNALGEEATFYYGPLNDAQREENKAAFLDPLGPKYLCLTAATGAEGIDGLQRVCGTAIYYSNTFNSLERWQSEDRIHRIGMGDKALYIDLVARGSIDRHLLRNLAKKKALSDLVLDVGRSFGIEERILQP